ncbi:MAG: hypothetical protein BWY66_00382 [bacterium ADurb.Bin374]|nr:MAG: hypothetical protein BWY66_00382 [bacterium ADurb.Bin374]
MPYVYVDRREADDPMKLTGVGESWYRSGRNHRIENGNIARDFDEKRWTVRIKDAAALARFVLKHGQVVLSINNDGLAPYFEIEIYDDYRE